VIASSGRAALMSSRSPTNFVMRPGCQPEFWCIFCHFRYRSSVLVEDSKSCLNLLINSSRVGGYSLSFMNVRKAPSALPSVRPPYQSTMSGVLASVIWCLDRYRSTDKSHRFSLSGLRSSPSPLNLAGAGILGGGILAGGGSATVAVSGSGGGGGGGPGRSGGCLPRGLSALSSVSENAPGVVWSLEA